MILKNCVYRSNLKYKKKIHSIIRVKFATHQVSVLMVNYKGRPFQPSLTESKGGLRRDGGQCRWEAVEQVVDDNSNDRFDNSAPCAMSSETNSDETPPCR